MGRWLSCHPADWHKPLHTLPLTVLLIRGYTSESTGELFKYTEVQVPSLITTQISGAQDWGAWASLSLKSSPDPIL